FFVTAFMICLDTIGTKREHDCAAGQGLWFRCSCQRGSPVPLTFPAEALSGIFPKNCVMKPTLTAATCAAFAGLLLLSQSAIAEPKTARQCNGDWAANKAAIQARAARPNAHLSPSAAACRLRRG